MNPGDCSAPLPAAALRGLELFNSGEFFEAHEALESAWRDEPGDNRLLYQAILQVAVTYYHIERGNYAGAQKVAARCMPKLATWPATCCGVDVAALRQDFSAVLERLTRLGPEHIREFEPGSFKAIRVES
jgi:predicted metal-dependent hydrolase